MYFVNKNSVVHKIWGKTDTVLFIFAAASAEFALHKSVDWLYHTGKLPADPLGRLFSTVHYAQQILFATEQDAVFTIRKINGIHAAVETDRRAKIPNRAYQDVLYMLIDYTIRSFELLERRLSPGEKEEVYFIFKKVGQYMQIADLPADHEQWKIARKNSLSAHYYHSVFTADLFLQYKKHLGGVRFWLLKQVQAMMAPGEIIQQLNLHKSVVTLCLFYPYKVCRFFMMNNFITRLFVPVKYKQQVRNISA